jgi:hypothetical protein
MKSLPTSAVSAVAGSKAILSSLRKAENQRTFCQIRSDEPRALAWAVAEGVAWLAPGPKPGLNL